jgi:DNA repair protein RadC
MKSIKKYELKKNSTEFERVRITGSTVAEQFIRKFYSDDIGIFESFFILMVDQSNHTIGYAKISQGGVAGTVVDPIIVAKYAIDSLSKGVILAHNHPSGNLTPSEADRTITNKIKAGLNLFDITVLDHIILTEDSFTSFADEGFL